MACRCRHLSLLFFAFCVQLVSSRKLFLLMVDGFRHDYLEKEGLVTPGFDRLKREGTRAEYMIPEFPTESYPNYFSIMTGKYVESHGIVANTFYDPVHNMTFDFGVFNNDTNGNLSFWFEDAESLWVTAAKQKKESYMYYWPGSEVEINGYRPTFWKRYWSEPSWDQYHAAVDDGLDAMKNGSADIVGIYIVQIDYYGHWYGANDDPRLIEGIQEVDEIVTQILDGLDRRQLKDEVDIMLFGDHGMANIALDNIVNLAAEARDLLNDIAAFYGGGIYSNIWPKPGKLEKIYETLKLAELQKGHFHVYKKNEIPDRWHYKHNNRIAPIVAVAEPGWILIDGGAIPRMKDDEQNKGYHGYDNTWEQMGAVFLARGPDFKKHHVVKPFANVNLYQVMCDVLDIEPLPHNGTWGNITDMLETVTRSSSGHLQISFTYNVLCVIIGILLAGDYIKFNLLSS